MKLASDDRACRNAASVRTQHSRRTPPPHDPSGSQARPLGRESCSRPPLVAQRGERTTIEPHDELAGWDVTRACVSRAATRQS